MDSRRPRVEYRAITTEAGWEWFLRRVPGALASDAKGIEGLYNGVVCCSFVMQHITPGSAEVHWAIDRPIILKHGALELIFKAAFGESRQALYGLISENGMKSRRLSKHVGYKESGRIPNGYAPGIDMTLFTLAREDCRYLE